MMKKMIDAANLEANRRKKLMALTAPLTPPPDMGEEEKDEDVDDDIINEEDFMIDMNV